MDFTNATCVQFTDRGMKNFWLSSDLKDQLQARTLCRACPVRIECALYVSEAKPSCGVWAGQLFGSPDTEDIPFKRPEPRKSRAKANR